MKQKRTKIAQFIDTDSIGGAEVMLFRLTTALKSRGYDVSFISFGHPTLEGKLEEHGVPCLRAPGYSYYKSILTLPIFAKEFRSFLKTNDIGLIHTHLLGPAMATGLSVLFSEIKHIATLHDTYTIEERLSRLWLLRLAAETGSRFVTVSQSMQAFLNKQGLGSKRNSNQLSTIYNGVPLPQAATREMQNGIRNSLGLSPSDFLIICVARLVALKSHEIVISAFADLIAKLKQRESAPGATEQHGIKRTPQLLLAGSGPRNSELQEMAEILGVRSQVQFLGERTDVESLLKASDCFVLASTTEGLSCSILEAMSTGLPCIVTNVGGNEELIIHNQTGLVIPPNSQNQLTENLCKLYDNPAWGSQLGAEGRLRAERLFSIEAMVDAYERVYNT